MKKTTPKRQPWLIAHRGAKTEAPENTRSAFDTALTYPIDGIELDVQLSKDDIPVLYHDRTLKKFNVGAKSVSDFSFQQLKKFDWGGWFDKDYRGEDLLTLKETLSRYSKKTRLLIEIKSYRHDRKTRRSIRLCDHVLKLIGQTVPSADRKNIFLLSFDLDLLNYANTQGPHGNYVLNLREPLALRKEMKQDLTYLHAFCLPIRSLTNGFVGAAHKRGQRVMTYSCNITRQVKKALDLKVDAIMTDKPGWLARILYE